MNRHPAFVVAAALSVLAACGGGSDATIDAPARLKDQGPGASVEFMRPKGEVRELDFTVDEGTQLSVDVSPDGQWILFDLLGHIYRIPAAGGEAVSLTQGSGIALNFHPTYSPDGTQIAFVSDRSGQNNAWVMHADGSEPRPVRLDPNGQYFDPEWHPNGESLVAVRAVPSPGRGWHRRNMTLMRLPLDGGDPVELLSDELAHYTAPAFSPDGRFLYFNIAYSTWRGNGLLKAGHRMQRLDTVTREVVNVRLDEPAEPTQEFLDALERTTYAADVAGDNPAELMPELSPDGRLLAFAIERPDEMLGYRGHELRGHTGLMIRNLESGKERLLVPEASKDMTRVNAQYAWRAFPGYAWAPDGESVILARGGKIHRVDVESGEDRVIPFEARVHRVVSEQVRGNVSIEDEAFDVRFIQWPASSPAGDRLVFVAVGRLWLMTLPDGRPRPLTARESGVMQLTPAWSPDGRLIAFATWSDSAGGQVWTVPASGSEPVQMTEAAAQYLYPTFSPDGKQILVTRGPERLWPAFEAPQPGIATAGDAAGGMGAEWRLVLLDRQNGDATSVISLDRPRPGTFLDSGRIVTHGQDDVAASFDLRSPYPDDAALGQVVRVRSFAPDGSDPRVHAIFPPRLDFFGGSNDPVLSPDGRRVAYQAGRSVYVSDLAAVGEQPARVDPDPNVEVEGRIRLGEQGGLYARWRNDHTVEFASGRSYLAYDFNNGELTKIDIPLRVPRDIPRGTVALSGAKIIPVDGDRIIKRGDVVIEGARIACVGECDVASADRVLDVEGKVIIPGLVDVHAHHTTLPANIVRPHMPAQTLALAYGVTTIVDPAAVSMSAFPLAESIEAGAVIGPRTFSSAEIVVTQAYAWGDNLEITRPAHAAFNARYRALWGAVELKNYRLGSRAQHQYLIEAARQHGVSVTSEGGPLLADLGFAMDGQTGFEHFIAPIPLYRDTALFLGKLGMHYSPTVIVAGHVHGAKDWFRGFQGLLDDPKYNRFFPRRQLEELHARTSERPKTEFSFPLVAEGLADIVKAGGYGALGEHGEQFGIGTHWELWAYAEALTAVEALKVGTYDGAHYVGLDSETGSIEVGKLADLIVLNSDPMEDIRNSADIAYVVKAGNVYDDETLQRIWPDGKEYGPVPWRQAGE